MSAEHASRGVDEIPVARTPPSGYASMPPPFLEGCDDPLIAGAPDLRGTWQVVDVTVAGDRVEGHPALGAIQRIEQAADRMIVTAGRIVHDMRCDGSLENGVHDVAEFDLTTEVHVTASYEDGVHVLRPAGLDIEVRRWRDGDHMLWQYVGFDARLERVDPSAPPIDTDERGAP